MVSPSITPVTVPMSLVFVSGIHRADCMFGSVTDGVRLIVGVRVIVGVSVMVGVLVMVEVNVIVGVGVIVAVGVKVIVDVGVGVAVAVGIKSSMMDTIAPTAVEA
jgi:hypothetical protein